MRTIKHVTQDLADNALAQAKLRKEGRDLMAVGEPTPEQSTRLTAIEADIDALVTKRVALEQEHARAVKFADEERSQGTPSVALGHDHRADRPWGPPVPAHATEMQRTDARHAALGEYCMAIRAAAEGTGFDPRLQAAATGMGSAVPKDGGFAVPSEVAAGIERNMFESGDVLSRVDARTVTGDNIAYNVFTETSRADGSRQGGILGYWVDQGTAPTATQFQLERFELKLRKVGALGYMTDELMADAAALGGELEAAFSRELLFQVENTIFRGTGDKQPLGFLSAPCLVSVSKETNQAAATINTTNLSKMWARMPAWGKRNAVWFINVDCEPQLDELALPVGTGGLQPRFVNYNSEGILTIKGRPVIPVEYSATVGTVGDIALVDMRNYRLIRKGGVEQASSIHVKFAQGETAFRAFWRVDGQPVPRSAITPFKGSNTLSPFVVLATRA